jgi:hypothetical protein
MRCVACIPNIIIQAHTYNALLRMEVRGQRKRLRATCVLFEETTPIKMQVSIKLCKTVAARLQLRSTACCTDQNAGTDAEKEWRCEYVVVDVWI